MNLFALFIGILLPTANGYLLLRILEKKEVVLVQIERIALGCVTGITLTMYLVFLVHTITQAPLVLHTFLFVQLLCTVFLLLICHYFELIPTILYSKKTEKEILSRWMKVLTVVIGLWIFTKILVASVGFIVFSPTYLDDSLNNWNLRGKVFYEDRALTLVMPNENPLTSPQGVSSYPPTVPLMKTWLATLAGNWNDPLVNSVQLVWYISALILLYFALRRHAGTVWAILGTYILGSMPLYLIHGTNAYADAFLSVHIFAAVSMLFHAVHAKTHATRMAFLKIAAFATALLPFTKNEAMLIYLPPILLLFAITLIWMVRVQALSKKQLVHIILFSVIGLLCVAGPWLLFKWSHGLTFGNGKPFTTLGFGWQDNVLISIAINTFFEGNWLLLFPLLFALILWKWRTAWTHLSLLTAFFFMIYIGQGSLYLFTGLSTEALRQTGYARGLIQILPVIVFLTTLLLQSAFPHLSNTLSKKAQS